MRQAGRGSVPARALVHVPAWLSAALMALLLAVALPGGSAAAHGGGTPRMANQPAGPYRLYTWTQPEPMRAGEVHLTIAVTQATDDAVQSEPTETPITDATVVVTLTPLDGSSAPLTVQATLQSSLGSIYYETDAILPSAGDWRVSLAVQGREGSGQGEFTMSAAAPRQANWTLIAIGGILLLGILALIIWRTATPNRQPEPPRRVRRASGGAAPAPNGRE